jgi:MFS transporter, DHA2 family, multidrug resistance protein
LGPAQISHCRGGGVLTNTYADLGFRFFALSRIMLGVGLLLVFVSITTASYDGIPPDEID